MKETGRRIRERRQSLNMTQEELAHKVGYKSKSSINKIELGQTDITQKKLMQFANVLDTTASYLMGWESNVLEHYSNALNSNTSLEKKEEATTPSAIETLLDHQQCQPFGDQLDVAMKEQDITAPELSEMLGLDENILHSILNKEFIRINAKDFGRIVGALRMDYSLIDENDKYIDVYIDDSYERPSEKLVKELAELLPKLNDDDIEYLQRTLEFMVEKNKKKYED